MLFLFHSFNHPTEQKVSSISLLSHWYKQVFDKAYEQELISEVTSVYDIYFHSKQQQYYHLIIDNSIEQQIMICYLFLSFLVII